jgi:hypothetical protein
VLIPSLLRLVAQVGDDGDNGPRADDGGVVEGLCVEAAERLVGEPELYERRR